MFELGVAVPVDPQSFRSALINEDDEEDDVIGVFDGRVQELDVLYYPRHREKAL